MLFHSDCRKLRALRTKRKDKLLHPFYPLSMALRYKNMDFDDLTHCSVCREIFTNPQKLLCNHSFCKACVDQLKSFLGVKCPLCSKRTPVREVKADFRLAAFQEKFAAQAKQLAVEPSVTASAAECPVPLTEICELCERSERNSYCIDCKQWMCNICKGAHLKSNASKGHDVKFTKEIQAMLEIKQTQEQCQQWLLDLPAASTAINEEAERAKNECVETIGTTEI